VRRDLPDGSEDKIKRVLNQTEDDDENERLRQYSVFRRTKGVGILRTEDAIRLGATGPV